MSADKQGLIARKLYEEVWNKRQFRLAGRDHAPRIINVQFTTLLKRRSWGGTGLRPHANLVKLYAPARLTRNSPSRIRCGEDDKVVTRWRFAGRYEVALHWLL